MRFFKKSLVCMTAKTDRDQTMVTIGRPMFVKTSYPYSDIAPSIEIIGLT